MYFMWLWFVLAFSSVLCVADSITLEQNGMSGSAVSAYSDINYRIETAAPMALNVYLYRESGDVVLPLLIDDIIIRGEARISLRRVTVAGKMLLVIQYDSSQSEDTIHCWCFELPPMMTGALFVSGGEMQNSLWWMVQPNGKSAEAQLALAPQLNVELVPLRKYERKQVLKKTNELNQELNSGYWAAVHQLRPAQLATQFPDAGMVPGEKIAVMAIYQRVSDSEVQPLFYSFAGKPDLLLCYSKLRLNLFGDFQSILLYPPKEYSFTYYEFRNHYFGKAKGRGRLARMLIGGKAIVRGSPAWGSSFVQTIAENLPIEKVVFWSDGN